MYLENVRYLLENRAYFFMNYRGGINGDKFDGALAQAQAMVRRFEG